MAKQEEEVKIERNDISIDHNGNVVIKNAELKKRAEALLKDKTMAVGHALALDNCDCHCGGR
jgi:hypothetical protein